MKQSAFNFLIFSIVFYAFGVNALEGIKHLEQSILENNPEVLSLKKIVEAQEALSDSSMAGYFPSFNAVGGLGKYKTDEFPGIEQGYIGYIEGRLNLFKGFKDQIYRDQRKVDVDFSKLELELKKRDLRLQFIEVTSEMIYLHKLQRLFEEDYDLTQIQKKMASKKVSSGLTGSVDNLEFSLRENEIQIEQRQINQQHQEVHQKFIKLFGEDVSDKDLEKVDFNTIRNFKVNFDQIKIENTLDYQKAVLNQNRFILQRKEVRSDYLPSLDFTYTVGRLTPSEESPTKFDEYRYALLVNIPLFSGFGTYNRSKSTLLMEQSGEKLKDQRLREINSDINISKIRMSELVALYEIYEQKIANSKKYFDLTLGEYRRGVKNSPDLVSATERVFLAKKKKYEILKELEVLKIKIENYN